MKSKTIKYLFLTAVLTSFAALAVPPNTITLDGRPLEYDNELRASSTNLAPAQQSFGPGNTMTNLYVTWDETYLYIALQGAESGNKLAVLIDADPEAGTGATTTTNWTGVIPDFIQYQDVGWQAASTSSATAFGMDYTIQSEGFYNNIVRVLYDGVVTPDTNIPNVESLFDNGNGNTPTGGDVDMVVQADGTVNDLKGIEARIPWAEFYGSAGRFGTVSAGQVVPSNATIRLLAILHNNDPASSYSSEWIIPNQTSVNASYNGAGIWTSDDYVDVVIDADSNGIPDVAVGDVNAPFLKFLSGVQSNLEVYAQFSEDVDQATAELASNWLIDGNTPDSATLVADDAVLLTLTNELPAAGTLVRVMADDVEDTNGNAKTTYNYFDPADSGISSSVVVRFLLNTASGMGHPSANPRVTSNFFINGNIAPLEFGFPPAETAPLTMLSATQYYRDVTFPAGSSTELRYKYSGILDGGGSATDTNNYEAVRLANYADAARHLTLPTNGTGFLVVTDWLGAAAAPYRSAATNTGYNSLYVDSRRGDAGVRQRVTMLFQLDLSQRNLAGIDRVLVQGSDPLRGFNSDSAGIGDFAANGAVGWDVGGIDLVDDGTLGDEVADDGIFSRLWAFSTNGVDVDIVVPDFVGDASSLVGGNFDDVPYNGGWLDGRSPRSFIYKFYVYKDTTEQAFESPAADIEYYMQDAGATNITLDPFVWDNGELPLPPPSNAPTMLDVSYSAGSGSGTFTNEVTELQHGWQVSTDLIAGWEDYGGRAVTTTVAGIWTFSTAGATDSENYRAFAGPPKPFQGVWADPYPIPETGATVRIYYTQHNRGLAGDRNVQIAGNWTGWSPTPMTFMGDGLWYYDLVANTSVFPNTEIKFKPRNADGSFWDGMGGGGNDFFLYVGDLRATFSNNHPTNGELFTITYDANGGPLSASTMVNAYLGFDEQWYDAGNRTMTNVVAETNVWELSFLVPTNYSLSINMVFNDGSTWDSEGSAPPNGRQWRVFLDDGE